MESSRRLLWSTKGASLRFFGKQYKDSKDLSKALHYILRWDNACRTENWKMQDQILNEVRELKQKAFLDEAHNPAPDFANWFDEFSCLGFIYYHVGQSLKASE